MVKVMAHDHTVAPATADEYERALTAAEVNPGGMTSRQKDLVGKLTSETGPRGNRARAVLGQS